MRNPADESGVVLEERHEEVELDLVCGACPAAAPVTLPLLAFTTAMAAAMRVACALGDEYGQPTFSFPRQSPSPRPVPSPPQPCYP